MLPKHRRFLRIQKVKHLCFENVFDCDQLGEVTNFQNVCMKTEFFLLFLRQRDEQQWKHSINLLTNLEFL